MNRLRARARASGGVEDGDKAFWISFADLMTALMVLFLMVMAAELLSITQSLATVGPTTSNSAAAKVALAASEAGVSPPHSDAVVSAGTGDPQSQAVDTLLMRLAQAAKSMSGVQLDANRRVIDFGDRARFPTGSYQLDAQTSQLLRSFAPSLLQVTESELGKKWIRRVVVEGFADPRGSYLYNLNLSLQRGERVICTLLETPEDGAGLASEQRLQVRDIFAVGGFSFNDPRDSLDASRRIELRIEFGPPPATPREAIDSPIGPCALPS